MILSRTVVFWLLIFAAFMFGVAGAGWMGGILAAIVMYFLQAFVVWLFDLDGLRKHRFFWEKKR